MEFRMILLAIVTFLLAYNYDLDPNSKREADTIQGWQQQLDLDSANSQIRIAVGLNANVDLILPGVDLLNELGAKPNGTSDHLLLRNINDVQDCFARSMKSCSAAERTMESRTLYQEIVASAEKIKLARHRIGGNAALLGETIANLLPNASILLVGPVGPRLKSLLNPRIKVPVVAEQDEVHLILEYERDEKWGDIKASCANRFIMSNDIANSDLQAIETFAKNLKEFQPNVVVISGLHLMENKPKEFRMRKLKAMIEILGTLPSQIPIHLELASMADIDFVRDVVNTLLPHINSLGLNEQELHAVSRALNGPHTKEDWTGTPEIALVGDILYWLLHKFSQLEDSKLSRIHFHSLTYHIVSQLAGSWNNSLTATGAAARLAGLRACNRPEIVPQEVELQLPSAFIVSLTNSTLRRSAIIYDPRKPVSKWSRGSIDMFLSPVLVCKKPRETVGLGDAISGTGLLYSKFINSKI
ncbi:ADP-dependent glucokinase [Trichoplax sp. H2]|nr:ADP-dependent glucokinase [Trichoplax sp. H2]|eukprot:RDD45185.1 ADP-dependent glucokinase [Trichoplax sp. H2]